MGWDVEDGRLEVRGGRWDVKDEDGMMEVRGEI